MWSQGIDVGFPIGIMLRCSRFVRNCAQLYANCAQFCGIASSLQGSQLSASEIHLRWNPLIDVRDHLNEDNAEN